MRRKKIKKNLPEEKGFAQQLCEAINELYYISETDSEIFSFEGGKADEVLSLEILNRLGRKDSIEERNFDDFFKRLVEMQEWFGDEEIRTANRFNELKELLSKNLRDIKVFKVGKIEVDIYIVGLDKENILRGVWTKAVET